MGQSTPDPNSADFLRDLLKRTAEAHGRHEQELGKPDPDWPQWYAEYMARTLREAGYRISRGST
jgi:hypothetical protein